MATAGKMNGNVIGLYVGATLLTHALTESESHSMSAIDVTTKDSASQEEIIAGLRGSELSCSGYFAENAAEGYEEMFVAYQAATLLTILVSSGVSGDVTYTYTAYITSLSRTAEHDSAVGFECSLKPTGAVTPGTVS